MNKEMEIGRSCVDSSEIFRITYDADRNLLHAVCRGFWAPDDTITYIDGIVKYIRLSHSRHGIVRFLIDRRQCPVQVAEVVSRIRQSAVESFWPNDRKALIVASALVQRQVQRVLSGGHSMVFEDAEAATAWLLQNE